MAIYAVRFVHKISPRDTDVENDVSLTPEDTADRYVLGAALRVLRLLPAGERLRDMREESGRVIAFPLRGIWHSIILTYKSCCSDPRPLGGRCDSCATWIGDK